jgi:hypothetical protein
MLLRFQHFSSQVIRLLTLFFDTELAQGSSMFHPEIPKWIVECDIPSATPHRICTLGTEIFCEGYDYIWFPVLNS